MLVKSFHAKKLLPSTEIEDRVLICLGLEIKDLELISNLSSPQGDWRYAVYRYDRPLFNISKWGDRYHTRASSGQAGYPSLYAAATCWVRPCRLREIEGLVDRQLRLERSQVLGLPDYM